MAAENKAKKEKKEKKGSKVILIIVGVVFGLVLIGGVAFGAYYFAAKNITPVANAGTVVVQEGKGGEVVTFELDEFLVNLADEGKSRYLKAKIFIGYISNEELAAELATKKPIIRDTVNNVLRTKKTTELSAQGEEAIKKELADKINDLLTKGKISNVYFSEILIQ